MINNNNNNHIDDDNFIAQCLQTGLCFYEAVWQAKNTTLREWFHE